MKTLMLAMLFACMLHTTILAQVIDAQNGLSTASGGGSTLIAKLGGTLYNAQTSIDFGSGNSSSSLLFKKGSSDYLYIGNNGNIGVGTSSPAAKLHVIGEARFENSTNTTPFFNAYRNGVTVLEVRANTDSTSELFNLFIGKDAGLHADADSAGSSEAGNIGIGDLTLSSMLYGDRNSAIGSKSLSSMVYGSLNVGLGHNTLRLIDSGTANTAIGSFALGFKNRGDYNTALGVSAGAHSHSGSYNTYIGFRAGLESDGNGNVFLGYNAGNAIGAGNYNVIIGANDGSELDEASNHIIISDGQGTTRLKINNNGAYYIGGSYGTSGQVLTSNGGGDAPTWEDAPSLWAKAGNIGIGLDAVPAGYKLAVAGNIIAEKITARPPATGWPDFVFHPEYNLLSLKETEQFIKANNHLPGVPAAEEIEKNGLDLGNGQATLLKKIEELTLYMIEMNRQIEKLAEENKQLKRSLSIK